MPFVYVPDGAPRPSDVYRLTAERNADTFCRTHGNGYHLEVLQGRSGAVATCNDGSTAHYGPDLTLLTTTGPDPELAARVNRGFYVALGLFGFGALVILMMPGKGQWNL